MTKIKSILESNGMLNFYLGEYSNKNPFVHNILFQRLIDNFHQEAFENIKKDTSKLRTYSLFKSEIGFENYLTEIRNVSERSQTTKFRLSNHGLMIEVGRHHNTPRDKRFCPFCPRRIENEFHFLYECPTFEHLRSRFLKPTTDTLPGFAFLHNDMKIHILLSSMVNNTSKYIAKGMELRSFLLSKPKSLN